MSSKERTQHNDTSPSGQQAVRPETQSTDIPNPAHAAQQGRMASRLLTPGDVLQLQRTLGNQAVNRLLAEMKQCQLTTDANNHSTTTPQSTSNSSKPWIQRRELDIPGYGYVNTNRMTQNELFKLFYKLEDEDVDESIANELNAAYENEEYLPGKKLSQEDKDKVANTLSDPKLVGEAGVSISTLPLQAEELYKAALLEGMKKITDSYHRYALKSRQKPAEDIDIYVNISRAATIMIKEAIGLHGSDAPKLDIIPQRAVPVNKETAQQMLWYLINDHTDMDKIHKQFKANKDAKEEDLIIGEAMTVFLDQDENLQKLHLIDQEWEASEIKGQIRVQTAHGRRQNMEKKHWDTLPVMIHEVLHAMTHPKYMQLGDNYPTALGRDTLVEGTTDLFKNYVLEYWKGARLETRQDIIELITGDPNSQVRKVSSKDYESIKQANDVLSIVSMANLIEAYFNGRTELLGL